jgi:hypothetical protein
MLEKKEVMFGMDLMRQRYIPVVGTNTLDGGDGDALPPWIKIKTRERNPITCERMEEVEVHTGKAVKQRKDVDLNPITKTIQYNEFKTLERPKTSTQQQSKSVSSSVSVRCLMCVDVEICFQWHDSYYHPF